MTKFLLSFHILLFIGYFVYAQSPKKLGKLRSKLLQEVSGIIPSVRNVDKFWVHNDSGDGPYIYLIDSLANFVQQFELEGCKLVDVEDIAWVNIDGEPYVLLADIGNNLRLRDTVSLYLFKEPIANKVDNKVLIPRTAIVQIKLKYADQPRDAEALFVDPVDNEVYLISKRDFRSQVFSFSLRSVVPAFHLLTSKVELPFNFVTAADISHDGQYVLLKNIIHVYRWDRALEEPIINMFKRLPKKIPYLIEPQGEAICFDLSKPYFYTLSERPFGLDAYLYRYDL